jgi:tyrosinase
VLGATLDVPLASTDPIDVDLAEPADVGLGLGIGDEPGAGRVFLRVEQVTGTAAAPVYQIHINLPPGEAPDERPDLRAGLMSTFGLAEASEDDGVHDGSGLTAVFDITPVRDALEQQGRWDPTRLQVTFSPVGADAELPDDADEAPPPTDVRAGQVMVVAT